MGMYGSLFNFEGRQKRLYELQSKVWSIFVDSFVSEKLLAEDESLGLQVPKTYQSPGYPK